MRSFLLFSDQTARTAALEPRAAALFRRGVCLGRTCHEGSNAAQTRPAAKRGGQIARPARRRTRNR